jgi:hypothetical protein
MAVAAFALALVATGCHDATPEPTPTPPLSSPTVAPVSGPVPLHLRLAAGQTLATLSVGPGNCPGVSGLVRLGSDGTVSLTAYAGSCPGGTNTSLGNGRHGVYRTVADIPADRRAAAVTVPTALGDAVVFNQPYYECTNSCHNYTEPVAVITLRQPQTADFRTLTVYSAKGTIGLERLTAFLRDQLLA